MRTPDIRAPRHRRLHLQVRDDHRYHQLPDDRGTGASQAQTHIGTVCCVRACTQDGGDGLQPAITATGSLPFGNSGYSVGLNYIDESGARFTEFFEVNAGGTMAVGSGTFTVRQQCPIASCIWLDIMGSQEAGAPAGHGSAGSLVASVVPEPATHGLMALGLVSVGAAAHTTGRCERRITWPWRQR